jgi:hypothetical protein
VQCFPLSTMRAPPKAAPAAFIAELHREAMRLEGLQGSAASCGTEHEMETAHALVGLKNRLGCGGAEHSTENANEQRGGCGYNGSANVIKSTRDRGKIAVLWLQREQKTNKNGRGHLLAHVPYVPQHSSFPWRLHGAAAEGSGGCTEQQQKETAKELEGLSSSGPSDGTEQQNKETAKNWLDGLEGSDGCGGTEQNNKETAKELEGLSSSGPSDGTEQQNKETAKELEGLKGSGSDGTEQNKETAKNQLKGNVKGSGKDEDEPLALFVEWTVIGE